MLPITDILFVGSLPLKRWLRMCSRMAAKLMNSSDESSMGSAVYFSNRVFTENLCKRDREEEGVWLPEIVSDYMNFIQTSTD